MIVLFGGVHILVSLKIPFHCANKMIPSKISMSGDYSRLEGNKGGKFAWPWGSDQMNLLRGGEFDQKNFPRGRDLTDS